MLIGVTGSIASGKSTFLRILEDLGFQVADADKIVKNLYRSGVLDHQLKEAFPEAFSSDKLDLRRLAEIAFSSKENLRKLEDIVHPKVKEIILSTFGKYKGDPERHAFLEVQLLIEVNWSELFDEIIIVHAPDEVRRRRAVLRGLSEEDFKRRDSRQLPLDEKLKRCKANYILVENTGSIEDLREKAIKILEKLGISVLKR